MKTVAHLASRTIILIALLYSSAYAITAEDLVGSWDYVEVNSLSIKGLFADTAENFGVVDFLPEGTFVLHSNDGYEYTGTYRANGKKVWLTLDESSLDEMDTMINYWIHQIAEDNGISLTSLNVNTGTAKITPAKLNRKAALPGRVSLKAQGTASATGTIEGRSISVVKKFKYSATIMLTDRHDD